MRATHLILGGLVTALAAGCSGKGNNGSRDAGGITPATHHWFPIADGVHKIGGNSQGGAIACESCHPPEASSFATFQCVGCHEHEQGITDLMHQQTPKYRFADEGCYACHASGECTPFDHAGISGNCAGCHDVNQAFAALPPPNKPAFMHPEMFGNDCGACHTTSTSCHQDLGWPDAGAAINTNDPNRNVNVDEYIPAWAGTTITSLSPQTDALPQPMNHQTSAVSQMTLGNCITCHPDSQPMTPNDKPVFYPGDLHSSLANAMLPEPTACADCHTRSMPVGFVGPAATNPARNPSGPEMKHDAVAWASGAPTTNKLLTQDCAVCHTSPSRTFVASWGLNAAGMAPAQYHPALAAASQPQPASCLDCHANTRPLGVVMSGGISFDHSLPAASDDCAGCHAASAPGFTAWAGGKFHATGVPTPTTCVPCHEGERPATPQGWTSGTYQQSPFDYGTSDAGILHGDGQDCALCHSGSTATWATGHLDHATAQVTLTTCLACHSTQRPDRVLGVSQANTALGFDHSLNGTGDCFGCHQSTVMSGNYVNYFKAGTSTLPGGDWAGGQTYPGGVLVSAPTQFITINEITLQRGGNNLITGMTSQQTTLYNAMLHTSAAIPAEVSPGPANMPDNTKCWHCHTNTNGTVTAYSNGQFHSALTNYRATPGGAVSALPQPTAGCTDCHSQMRPVGIVQLAGASIQSMDHSAPMNGVTLNTLDCSTCHKSAAGTAWSDGKLHPNLGSATPADCSVCHYPLMADATKADVTQTTNFTMKHRSTQMTLQKCDTCHVGAFGRATTTPTAATLWATGAFHVSLAAQPALCNDCHLVSEPASGASTKSAVVYTFAKGGTSSNGPQWMNHGSTFVAGKDCSVCHAADAKASGSAWLQSDRFHSHVANITSCAACHGLSNGSTVAGTNNNLPSGLTDSSVTTTASNDSTTGIAAGTHDQIDHTDVNVTAHDCNFCHTQVGPASGNEWAQAAFHKNFNSSSPLNTNGTTGRCSHCHMNVKPVSSFPGQDHSTFTNTSGSTDCSSCHSWPGTGGTSSPNWLGASGGVPSTISVGGFIVGKPPAPNTNTTEPGISNLPHPTVGSQACSVCHTGGIGGKPAIGYDHASTLINNHCAACHEYGSDLVGTPWNGTTGNTRPYNWTPLVPSFKGNSRALTNIYQHFYATSTATDCYQCHKAPTGTVNASTGSTYTSRWKFNHSESRMTNPTTCNYCHGSPNNIPD